MKFKCLKTGIFVESPAVTHRMAEGVEYERFSHSLAAALIAQGFMGEDNAAVQKSKPEAAEDDSEDSAVRSNSRRRGARSPTSETKTLDN